MNSSDTKFSNATLILFDSDEQTDRQIQACLKNLATIRCRTEVLLVRTEQPQAPLHQSVSHRPIPKTFPCLGQAIQAAKHPIIAILDSGSEIEIDLWKRLVGQAEQRTIQTLFYSRFQPRKLKKFLLWLHCLTVRLLLGTKKNELTQGLVILHRSAVNKTLAKLSHDQRLTSMTQLLAMAKLHGQRVDEYDMGNATSLSSIGCPLKSKSILRHLRHTIRFWWGTTMFPRDRRELHSLEKKSSKSKQGLITATLMLLGVFILFSSLSYPLFEPDEARNAQLALNVLESGQWMSLSLDQEPYWDKPPLQIWAIALSYKLFGVSEYSTRIPCAVASLFTLMLMLLVGKRLIGFRAAALGSLLLILTSGFVGAGRYVTMDASLTALTTAMMMFGWMAIRNQFSKGNAILAGTFCGLGFLVKGPIIAVLCLPPILLASWLNSKPSSQPKTRILWIWFLAPALLIAAPWFVAMAIVHPDFLEYFFWTHHVVRFADAFNHREPFWYYAIGIFLFMFPASYFLPSLAKFMTSRKPADRLWRTKDHGFLFLTALWIIGFFTMAESKLPTYIVPAFPPICLLMGVLLHRRVLMGRFESPEILGFTGASSSPSVSTDVTARPNNKRTFLEGIARRGPIELLLWLGVGCFTMFVLTKDVAFPGILFASGAVVTISFTLLRNKSQTKDSEKNAWVCFAIIAFLLISLSAHHLLPTFAKLRSIHIATEKLRTTNEFLDAPIVFYGRESFGSSLTHEPQSVISFKENQTGQLVDFLNWNPTAIIVSSEAPMESLRSDLPWTIKLDKQDCRHVYTSQPNATVIARELDSRKYR